MSKFKEFLTKITGTVRVTLSNVFNTFDAVTSEVNSFLKDYGEPMVEFLYTGATKLERALPENGFGNSKLAMLDSALVSLVIPALESLRGKDLSIKAKDMLRDIAKEKVAEFVKERNTNMDWDRIIEDLNKIEQELGIK